MAEPKLIKYFRKDRQSPQGQGHQVEDLAHTKDINLPRTTQELGVGNLVL
jgi:hypothetical protein